MRNRELKTLANASRRTKSCHPIHGIQFIVEQKSLTSKIHFICGKTATGRDLIRWARCSAVASYHIQLGWTRFFSFLFLALFPCRIFFIRCTFWIHFISSVYCIGLNCRIFLLVAVLRWMQLNGKKAFICQFIEYKMFFFPSHMQWI